MKQDAIRFGQVHLTSSDRRVIPIKFVWGYSRTPMVLVKAEDSDKTFRVTTRSLQPLVAPKEQDKPLNAGTCHICGGQLFKLNKSGNMVNHGYKRPGWGFLVGACMAVDVEPWEKSPRQMELYRPALVAHIERQEKHLKALQAGKVKGLEVSYTLYNRDGYHRETKKIALTILPGFKYDSFHGISSFEDTLRYRIMGVESDLKAAREDLDRVDNLLASWAPAPLKHKA